MELEASLEILTETNAVQARELKQMWEQSNAITGKKTPKAEDQGDGEKKKCPHCEVVGRLAPHGEYCHFNPKKMKDTNPWVRELMKAKELCSMKMTNSGGTVKEGGENKNKICSPSCLECSPNIPSFSLLKNDRKKILYLTSRYSLAAILLTVIGF